LPPWLHLLSAQEQAKLQAARPDALLFQKKLLKEPRRRAAYLVAPDPSGVRARALERLQTAWNTYSALSQKARQPMQKAAQGLPVGPDPPWLALLSARERAKYTAAQPDATAFQKARLTHPACRAEYRTAPDANGERAWTLQCQHAAYNVYSRLAAHGH
jgi:hypothetical protein